MFGGPKNIFELAKKLNKKLVFIIFEDKVFVTLANKREDGSITFEVKREFGTETYKLQIQPEQEFLLHTPKIVINKEEKRILDGNINIKPSNPKDVSFTLYPYNVECIFLVYPYEILNVDTLKNLGLIKTTEAILEQNSEGKKETITLDVYTPSIYLLDKKTIKMLTAKSRISQIDTILTMTRDLLLKSEGLFSPKSSPFEGLSKLLNWRFLLLVGSVIALIISIFFFLQIAGVFQGAAGNIVSNIIKPTFP